MAWYYVHGLLLISFLFSENDKPDASFLPEAWIGAPQDIDVGQ